MACKKWQYFIDASTRNMGIVLYCPEAREVLITSINFEKFKSNKLISKADNQFRKLQYIRGIIEEFERKYPVGEIIVMEGIFVNSAFKNSSEVLLKLHGLIMGYFYDKEFAFIPPKTIKKVITGNGNANKESVRDVIEKKYDIEFNDEDQSDAFALMLTYFLEKGIDTSKLKMSVKKYS